jgi:alpha-aminoadipate/glutamate carrier protein LysW
MLDSVPVSQEYEPETMMVVCPKCKSEIDVEEEELEEGELLSCTECDGDFEVASVEPLKLAKVSDEEEADEDDDE